MMKCHISYSDIALKQKKKLPTQVNKKLLGWTELIGDQGIQKARQIPGYHDEPLKGRREGQRSIRLNRQWRLIYEETDTDRLLLIEIMEITPHEY